MTRTLKTALLVMCLALVCRETVAKNSYVTDQVEITLRSGPGLNYKIIEMLTTGTALEKLDEQEGWVKVRTGNGSEGWVVSRYVTNEPPKGPRLAAAQKELETLRAETKRLKDSLEQSRAQGGRTSAQAKELGEKLDAVEKEFADWKKANEDVIAIRQRADTLAEEQEAARQELERLRTENRSLQAREKFYWFFSGVVVLLLGWVLGYVYSSSRHRARSQARFRF